MSQLSYSFKDNLTIDNNKFLKWMDLDGITKHNIIGLNENNRLLINSPNEIFIESPSDISINIINTSSSTIIGGLVNLKSTLLFDNNKLIGTKVSNGTLNISNNNTLDSSYGSFIRLDNSVSLFAKTDGGGLNFHTYNSSKKLEINQNGEAIFTPNGSTAKVSITDQSTLINNILQINNTTPGINASTGALTVNGGVGIVGDTFVKGILSIDSIEGNLDFRNTRPSINATTGAFYVLGGIGIANSTDATGITSGGGITNLGGFSTLGRSFFGNRITVVSTEESFNSLNGSLVSFGGIAANGQSIIRSDNVQLKLIPKTNLGSSILEFHYFNNYSTSGIWNLNQENNVFSINSSEYGSFISFDNSNINILKPINLQSGVIIVQSNGNLDLTASNFNINSNLNVLGDTTFGNINFTGELYQDGLLYVSSQWQGTSGILTYNGTGGVLLVGIGTTNPMATLDVNGGILTTNLTSPNSILINVTNGSLLSDNIVSSSITSGNINSSLSNFINSTVSNLFSMNITNSNLLASHITSGNINSSLSNFIDSTISNLFSMNITNSSLLTSNITSEYITGTLSNFINSTIANLFSTSILSTNINSTSINGTSVVLSNATITNLLVTTGLNSIYNSNTIANIITTGGNVGIGTTSPQASLHITNDGNPNLEIGNNTAASKLLFYGSFGDGFAYIQSGSLNTIGSLRFSQFQQTTTNMSRFEVYSSIASFSGNVGIGTTSPLTGLDIRSTIGLTVNSGINNGVIRLVSDTTASYLQSGNTFGNSSFPLRFTSYNNDTTWMSIQTSGNIGIGTTSPLTKLHVNTLSNNDGIVLSGATTGSTPTFRIASADNIQRLLIGIAGSPGQLSNNTSTFDTVIRAENANIHFTGLSDVSETQMVLMSSGNLGINTTTPGHHLDVNGGINGLSLTSGNILITSTTNSIGVGSGGSLTILGGTSVSKDIYVGGTVTSSSDKRLKKNIKPIEECLLDKIIRINTYTYNYNWEADGSIPQYGFIAQELIEEFPYLVKGSENEMYSVDYQKMTVILLKCIKELHNEIRLLKTYKSDPNRS